MAAAIWLMGCVAAGVAQTGSGPATPKTIFRDAAGNLISNNEFVDLRLANPHEKKDPATKIIHDDGTIEFRLAAVPQEGRTAPVFDLPLMNDRIISAEELSGKVIVYNFWFIGCPGCLEEMPKLNELASRYKDNPNVLFIAVSHDSPAAIKQFLTRERFDYLHAGSARSILNLFTFSGYPRNIVVGKDGRIAYWRTTVHAWDKFDSVIKSEIAKTSNVRDPEVSHLLGFR